MSEENDNEENKGEATAAPGGDILPPDIDIKTVGEYLQWLEKGVHFSHSLLYQIVVKLADFHHDQGLAHIRFMDTLAEMLPSSDPYDPDDPDDPDDGPHLTVVE